MNQQEVIERLSRRRDQLEAMGVASLALFGSTVRNESSGSSDIDLLISFNRPMSLFDYADIERYLTEVMGNVRIDLVHREAVLDELKEPIFREAVSCL